MHRGRSERKGWGRKRDESINAEEGLCFFKAVPYNCINGWLIRINEASKMYGRDFGSLSPGVKLEWVGFCWGIWISNMVNAWMG